MSSSSSMRRPGPLQELPLDRFLPPNPNLPLISPFKSIRPHKRPLSPGAPNLFSPTKRRILDEEGIFSPDKSLKRPMSASRGRASSPSHFTDVLHGPDSPARKLDFGVPKNHSESNQSESRKSPISRTMDVTPPRQKSTNNRLAPSPELIPTKSKSTQSSSPSSSRHSDDPLEAGLRPCTRSCPSPSPRSTVTPTVIRVELPPPPDPQSIHYPGFCVHQDAQIVILPAMLEVGADKSISAEKDWQKENVPLRKKTRQSSTGPSPSQLKTLLFSPNARKREVKKIEEASTPVTPKKADGWERLGSLTPTPRRPNTNLTHATLSTPVLKKEDKWDRRRMLEDETDNVGSDGEDELLR